MKKLTLITILSAIATLGFGQTWKLGMGVQTFTRPLSGILIEADHNQVQNERFETITRLSLGYRKQTLEHSSIGIELSRGFRLKINSNLYVEQAVGLGTMHSFYTDHYWYTSEWYNLIYTGKKGRTFDVVPSAAIGVGYHFGGEMANANHLWVRPKVFLQLPSNNPSNPYFTLQIGYSRSLL